MQEDGGQGMRKKRKTGLVLLAVIAMLAGSGCSRSVLNYQIAECIGTLGEYENNEPVETPKMKAAREQKESESELENVKQEALDAAAKLAKSYRYEEAIAYLQNTEELQGDARLDEAIAEYEKKEGSLYQYTGDIPHFSFTNLVMDPTLAFDGDEYESVYRQNMITATEFENILQALYDNNYILIDIHSLANETESGSSVTMSAQAPTVPEGKKPMILSVDNLSYSSMRNGDGVATSLTVGADGKVDAVYTDADGHDQKGDYDVIPLLEAFIEAHPDFSFQGARGIVSVAGARGVFGYTIDGDNADNQKAVKEIAAALKDQGWTIASSGYSYEYMYDMSYETLSQDITNWLDQVGSLVGDSDTLLYPYGSEVDYGSEKGSYLINRGFRYLIGMWADGDHTEVNETYLRQTRRMVTGYVFENSPSSFSTYFDVSEILDPER